MVLKNNSNNNGNYNNIVTYLVRCIYLVIKILHFLKLKYKESNPQDEPPCSNVTTLQTGSLTCTWDVTPCIGEVGVGGIVYYKIQRIVHLFHVIHATDIH